MISRVKNYIRKLLCGMVQFPRIVFYRALSSRILIGTCNAQQPVFVYGNGKIFIMSDVIIGYFPSPYFFSTYAHLEARNQNASIKIGEGTKINNNFVAIAEHSSITIGDNVLIGTNVEICDSDFHGRTIVQRTMSKPDWAKPVIIQNDVFIGNNVKILKGVRIGSGSLIGNGSVVSKDIPSNVIAAGNPAMIINNIE